MITIYQKLIQAVLPGKILAVQVSYSRTAVLAETGDGIRCGLAATLSNPDFEHHRQPAVRHAGHLHEMLSTDLVGLVESPSFTEVAVGLAAINALLPRNPNDWIDLNAEDYLLEWGANKKVAVIGHFPFVHRLRTAAKKFWVLELNPKEGDYPAHLAPYILPQADLVAITATTLINKTFEGIIERCRPNAKVIIIGPSTPISPILYDYGIHIVSGTIVTDPEAAILGISQGISLSQLRQAGLVRLVTLKKDDGNGKQ